MGLDGDQRGDRKVGELGPAVQEGQLEQYGDARHPSARPLHQIGRGAGARVAGISVLLELAFLHGRAKLADLPVTALITV